jgi:hypothetical protein
MIALSGRRPGDGVSAVKKELSCLQLGGEFGGGGYVGVAGIAGGEVFEQGAGDAFHAAACGGEAGYCQGGGGGFGAKIRVEFETMGDDVEGFAGALVREESLDMLFGQTRDVAGIGPGCDSLAESAVVVGCMAAGCQPSLQGGPSLCMGTCADLAVGGGYLSIALPQVLGASEVGGAFGGGPGFEPEFVAPLVEYAAENAEDRENAIHEYGDLHR